METLIALGVFVFAAFCLFAAIAFIGLVIKAIFWVVFFPIRLLFKLVFWTLGAGLAVVLMPVILLVVAVAIIGALVTALFSLLAPMIPVALVALVGWAIYRGSTRRPSPVI
jgi:hypothetical protein